MEAERFARLKRLLLGASGLSGDDRAAYLGQACPDDPELRREAESILAQQTEFRDGQGQTVRGLSVLETAWFGRTIGADSELPERIGRYSVLDELGRGGMGVVYLARDPRLERDIALKILPIHLARDSSDRSRFEREARILASMNHPNIATIFSLESDEDLDFLSMERIEGVTLAERLAERPLDVNETLTIGRQIARALEAAHKKGVIHRDLKPLNVMVTPENHVKVLDFGLAKAVSVGEDAPERIDLEPAGAAPRDATTEESPVRQSVIAGTPGYMSPEQLLGGEVDPRTDVFSFGCLLYECLSRRPAFGGSTIRERMAANRTCEPEIDALSEDTPPTLRGLVERCLSRDREDRLATMADARRALEDTIERRKLDQLLGKRRTEEPSHPHNLPLQLSSFVGRQREIEDLTRLLPEKRLLTLTGVGGCGKTRLALELGRACLSGHPDGVWLVSFGPLNEPGLVPQRVMAALGLKEEKDRAAAETLSEHLKKRELLLILDNCEHLVTEIAVLVEHLLRICPELRVLATSREALGIEGDTVYHVQPLKAPTSAEEASVETARSYEAVSLFVDRTRSVSPEFSLTEDNAATVMEICRRLDGIPLALELAAARVNVLGVRDVATHLNQRFQLLTRGARTAPPRHQTLRALIDWSHEQLDRREQEVFRRLSVFAGGWTLEAAEAVCAGNTIAEWEVLDHFTRLVDKSLVERDLTGSERTGQARYRMLETVRAYAREQLAAAGEERGARAAHRAYAVEWTARAMPHLYGGDQALWKIRLDEESDNLRVALEAAATAHDGAEDGFRLVSQMLRYWQITGLLNKGRAACRRALAHPDPACARSLGRAMASNAAGVLANEQNDYDAARAHAEDCLAISREHESPTGVAASLTLLGLIASDAGDDDTARQNHEESLAIYREIGHRPGMSRSLNNLGLVAQRQGDYERSRTYHEESLAVRRELGDQRGIAMSLFNLGGVLNSLGNLPEAEERFREGLALQREIGDRVGIAHSLTNLGTLLWDRNDPAQAEASYREGLALAEKIGAKRCAANILHGLGMVSSGLGDQDRARTHFQRSLIIRHELGNRARIASTLKSLGVVAAFAGEFIRGARILGAASAVRGVESLQRPPAPAAPDDAIAHLRGSLGDEGFEREWVVGRSMTMEEAIALASEDHAPPRGD